MQFAASTGADVFGFFQAYTTLIQWEDPTQTSVYFYHNMTALIAVCSKDNSDQNQMQNKAHP